ncbi:SDR family NAD(P)-dependent oxidoreductase [Thermocatellispora tengchongensis]|uniref:SDR family NAD(P)-dependent oxidoreductase n=1 Tax=Thermocatellispora tengchongensis TaxID=1073253 RepID=UPI00363B9B48
MDVTKEEDLQRAVRTILDEHGRIDVLVNNAGAVVHGAVEDTPLAMAREEFEINVFAPARLVQLVLPHMRRQRSGTIVNVSSVGGEIALPLGAWYYASKHALEAFSDTLRMETAQFGIDVVVIQPGIIRTDFEAETPANCGKFPDMGPTAKWPRPWHAPPRPPPGTRATMPPTRASSRRRSGRRSRRTGPRPATSSAGRPKPS